LERYRFTAADDEILKEFIRVAANVDLDTVDHKQFAGYAKRHGVYYWVMRYRGERFKIYAGCTNSLPRRIREYGNSFQSGVPNDYKLQHFQHWMRERFPDAELDLYFTETSDHGEREKEIIRQTRPFINKRAETDSAALLAVNREFFRAGFEKRMLATPKHRLEASRSGTERIAERKAKNSTKDRRWRPSLIPSARKPALDLRPPEGLGMGQIGRQFLLTFSGLKVQQKPK
jgi:hypothetical protein